MQFSTRALIAAALAGVGVAHTASASTPLQPRQVMAVLDGTQNFGTTRRAISFYDVTEVGSTGTANVFNQAPLFSVWTGFEDSAGTNFEDIDTITVNPFNGTLYAVAFDSGTPGAVDSAGDTEGDLDIYKIDYQELLNDFVTNSRPAGTMYAPSTGPDGAVNVAHPDNAGNTVFLGGAIAKVGEVDRTTGTSFFDRDVEFVDPARLVLVDNENVGADDPANDHRLSLIERDSGGVWSTDDLGTLEMDFDTGTGLPVGRSEPEDIALVNRDGVLGVWVAETDGGGDDLSFFEITGAGTPGADAVATKATLSNLGTSRGLDENPELDPNTNDGSHDWIKVDPDGNVVIGESGFFDIVPGGETGNSGNPAGEPSVLRLNVDQYQAGNVALSTNTWDDLTGGVGLGDDPAVAPTQLEGPLGSLPNAFAGGSGLGVDDDTAVTDGRFTTLSPDGKLLYMFDIDSGSLPNVVADVYVIDLESGEIVYEELNAANHFLIEHGIRAFVRGDANGDGVVNVADIDALRAAQGGDAIAQEQFDLTGDDAVDATADPNGDVVALVEGVLGTALGDVNLDGAVSIGDLATIGSNFGQGVGSYGDGDLNNDGLVTIGDLALGGGNFGFQATVAPAPSVTAVPEPATLTLLSAAGLGLLRRRRA